MMDNKEQVFTQLVREHKRGIVIAFLCVGTLALEYYSAKRLLSSCDAIIERLKMKDE